MRIAYFDCFSGISGDMILGSLIDAGLKISILERELSKLDIGDFKLRVKKVHRLDLNGTKLEVAYPNNRQKRFSNIEQIFSLIENSRLKPDVKRISLGLFKILEEKERRVHGIKRGDFQLEELGDIDSIIDIVGAVAGFEALGIKKIFASLVISGSKIGPVTLELLKGRTLQYKNFPYELVTPTGALLIAGLSEKEESPPPFKIEKVGYGAGDLELKDYPNLLRSIIGEVDENFSLLEKDSIYVLETNVDDSNPLVFERVFERLYEIGGMEVYLTPVQMKKVRAGVVLTALVDKQILNEAIKIIFEETTTFGIRTYKVDRFKLRRKVKTVKTRFGKVRVNVGYIGKEIMSSTPEYEDCKALAVKNKLPIRQILEEI